VKVWWRSGHLSARRSDLRKSLQTDGQTDRQTDDGRIAIALAHSWNELKINFAKVHARRSLLIAYIAYVSCVFLQAQNNCLPLIFRWWS